VPNQIKAMCMMYMLVGLLSPNKQRIRSESLNGYVWFIRSHIADEDLIRSGWIRLGRRSRIS